MSLVLKPIGSGKYSDIFSVESGTDKIAMKISYYREEIVEQFVDQLKKNNTTEAQKIKDMDAISVSNTFSSYVENMAKGGITPHYVFVYSTYDVKSFVERLPDEFVKNRIDELTTYQKRYNNVSFMELYSCDLTAFLTRSKYDETTLKFLIFQILYTIGATQYMLPGWRHNDLSTNNVLVKKKKKNVSTKYTIGDTSFYTSTKLFVGITDFDFVHVPDVKKLENHRVMSGNFKVRAEECISYDTHFFLKSVLRCLSKKHTKNYEETIAFLKDLDLRREDRQENELKHLDPLAILRHRYFDSLKVEIPHEESYKFLDE